MCLIYLFNLFCLSYIHRCSCHFDLVFFLYFIFFWLSIVEMLPMPNPFVPEEHEPWCPYSLVQMNCMIVMSFVLVLYFLLHVFLGGVLCACVFISRLYRSLLVFFNNLKGFTIILSMGAVFSWTQFLIYHYYNKKEKH